MKEFIRDTFHAAGLDIRRWDSMSVFDRQLTHILEYLCIELVLDVGAHRGQYAQMLLRSGYDGAIISYEPLSTAYDALRFAARNKRKWAVAPRCALGNKSQVMELNIAGGNASSSSLRNMKQAHLDAAPHTVYEGKEKITVFRLDTVALLSKKNFLKIDTQGYEMQVLEGATGILDSICGVQVELSTTELYEGQALDWQIKNWLVERGFELWAVNPFMHDPKTGRLLQYDAVFVRP